MVRLFRLSDFIQERRRRQETIRRSLFSIEGAEVYTEMTVFADEESGSSCASQALGQLCRQGHGFFMCSARLPSIGRKDREQESMDYLEFIARMTSHIPDKGQVMVRNYGLYANAYRGKVMKAGAQALAYNFIACAGKLIDWCWLGS
jgi:hypothetical protein